MAAALFGADLGWAAVRIARAQDSLQRFSDSVFDAPLIWPVAKVDGRNVLSTLGAANREFAAVPGELLAGEHGDGVTPLARLRECRHEAFLRGEEKDVGLAPGRTSRGKREDSLYRPGRAWSTITSPVNAMERTADG